MLKLLLIFGHGHGRDKSLGLHPVHYYDVLPCHLMVQLTVSASAWAKSGPVLPVFQ
jgi:hypothetical protein